MVCANSFASLAYSVKTVFHVIHEPTEHLFPMRCRLWRWETRCHRLIVRKDVGSARSETYVTSYLTVTEHSLAIETGCLQAEQAAERGRAAFTVA